MDFTTEEARLAKMALLLARIKKRYYQRKKLKLEYAFEDNSEKKQQQLELNKAMGNLLLSSYLENVK